MSDTSYLFRVKNQHIEQSGIPPEIDGDNGAYHSYFENEYGEQGSYSIQEEVSPS